MDLKNFIYKNQKLPEYCADHDKNFDLVCIIYTKQRKKTAFENMTDYKLIDHIINNIDKYKVHNCYIYYYHNIPLYVFITSEHPEVNYDHLIKTIKKRQKEDPSLTVEEIVDEYLLEKHTKYEKYYYNKVPLYTYCRANYYNYMAILKEIHRMRESEKYKHLSKNEIVKIVVEAYAENHRDEILAKKRRDALIKLQDIFEDDIMEFANICDILGLSITNVSNVVKLGLTFNQAINISWYYSDFKDINDKPAISNERLKSFISKYKAVRRYDSSIKCSTYDIYVIYKCLLVDKIDKLYERLNPTVVETFNMVCISNNIIPDEKLYNKHKKIIFKTLMSFFNETYINDKDEFNDCFNYILYNIICKCIGVDYDALSIQIKNYSMKKKGKSSKK